MGSRKTGQRSPAGSGDGAQGDRDRDLYREELLTLTAAQAESLGLATAPFRYIRTAGNNQPEDAETVRLSPGWEKLSGWLIAYCRYNYTRLHLFSHPEVLTAGFELPGTEHPLFRLYFGGHFCRGERMAGDFLFLLGIVLLLVEAFIPGFGIFRLWARFRFAAVLLSAASAEGS